MSAKAIRINRLCECGCGEEFECKITSHKRFLPLHKQKSSVKENHHHYVGREERICACGCKEKFTVRPKDSQKWINGHWARGRKRSDEVKKKLSEQKMGEKNPNYRDKAYNWKGGVSFIPYPLGWSRTFKEQIRYRDGYRCQDCGIPEIELRQRLDVHHIDEDKFNLDQLNLICLCRSCHSSRHNNRRKSVTSTVVKA